MNKGERNICNNYGGLSLLYIVYKIQAYAKIMARGIQVAAEIFIVRAQWV
jgi:hypothetical protein